MGLWSAPATEGIVARGTNRQPVGGGRTHGKPAGKEPSRAERATPGSSAPLKSVSLQSEEGGVISGLDESKEEFSWM